jgi:Fe-S cluster biogenesis protein NfuA
LSDLKINAKDLLSGRLFELSFSENIFFTQEVEMKRGQVQKNEVFLYFIFSHNEILEIFMRENILKVRLSEGSDWKQIAKSIADFVRANIQQLFSKDFIATYEKIKKVEHHEVVAKASEIIKDQISPALGAHNGQVSVKGFNEGALYLEFGGGCQGCSQISATLKDGIEKILMTKIPEIKSVVDLTDHNKGSNPYFN